MSMSEEKAHLVATSSLQLKVWSERRGPAKESAVREMGVAGRDRIVSLATSQRMRRLDGSHVLEILYRKHAGSL